MSETFVPITQERWDQERREREEYTRILPKRAEKMTERLWNSYLLGYDNNLISEAAGIIRELKTRIEQLERELEDS